MCIHRAVEDHTGIPNEYVSSLRVFGEIRLQSQGDADIAPSNGELDWLAVFRSAEEKKTEVENAEQGPSMLTYAELRQQNRELREVVDPTKPLSPYDRLRKQNRKVKRRRTT